MKTTGTTGTTQDLVELSKFSEFVRKDRKATTQEWRRKRPLQATTNQKCAAMLAAETLWPNLTQPQIARCFSATRYGLRNAKNKALDDPRFNQAARMLVSRWAERASR